MARSRERKACPRFLPPTSPHHRTRPTRAQSRTSRIRRVRPGGRRARRPMHEPTMRATNCIAERLRITSDDVSFGPTALSVIPARRQSPAPLDRGAPINVMGTLDADGWLRRPDATGATMFIANPPVLGEVLAESRARGRNLAASGLAVGRRTRATALKHAWRDELGSRWWRATARASSAVSSRSGFPLWRTPLGAVGPPFPDKEVRSLDDDETNCRRRETGELSPRWLHERILG